MNLPTPSHDQIHSPGSEGTADTGCSCVPADSGSHEHIQKVTATANVNQPNGDTPAVAATRSITLPDQGDQRNKGTSGANPTPGKIGA